jgi:PAT family beta-lactamase induction signal transducer AmpG
MAATPWLASGSWGFILVLSLIALAGATQDIAIDAYSIDILTPEEQGPANGVRSSAYRVALVASGGLMVWLSGGLGWKLSMGLFAASLGLVSAALLLWPAAHAPRPPEHSASRRSLRAAAALAWLGVIQIPRLWAVALFILLFKAGDAFLGPMVGVFWRASGFSAAQYGLVSGTGGTLLAIAGSLLGGALCGRWGLWRSLWIFGGLQAFSNLGYALAAGHWGVALYTYGASLAESFCGGLGNAPFLTLLMRLCDRRAAAGQYAALSALFGLSGAVSASCSGLALQKLGFAGFFALSFLIALPAFALLPWLPLERGRGRRKISASSGAEVDK